MYNKYTNFIKTQLNLNPEEWDFVSDLKSYISFKYQN